MYNMLVVCSGEYFLNFTGPVCGVFVEDVNWDYTFEAFSHKVQSNDTSILTFGTNYNLFDQ